MNLQQNRKNGTTRDWKRGSAAFTFGIGLTWIFWWPLWSGGGLIGGDIYPYYFPQKAFLADALKDGLIPLWNPLVGFGYPTLGESQTAALYPPNLLLYSQFDVNTAYNLSQLLHYIMAFAATWAFARRVKLSPAAATFAATAFVYGWFPARICLEWAIIGGAWFAAILWAATVFIQDRKPWALAAVGFFLGMDLLAGHYNLAFITLLLLMFLPFLVRPANGEETKAKVTRSLVPLLLIVSVGFMTGAVQLLPTVELKSLSQRQEVNEKFTPTYGHLPPAAISQLWQPWSWHGGEVPMDRHLEQTTLLKVPNSTNQVEAFLYCGFLTILIVALGCLSPGIRRKLSLAAYWRWFFVAIAGLIFATGWPTYYLADVPGFGFFRGPGRYSMVTALAFAVMAGGVLDAVFSRLKLRPGTTRILYAVLLSTLVVDLWAVSRQYNFGESPYWGRQVFYAVMVDDPPINHRNESALKKYFADQGDNVRLYAPGQNIPTLLGVSSLPVYLGIGPEIYESDQMLVDFESHDPDVVRKSISRLRTFGVTHLLLESPVNEATWDVTLIGEIYDALMNRALARREPFYFYSVNNALGRTYVKDHPEVSVTVISSPHEVEVVINGNQEISAAEIVLTDLNYPGWTNAVGDASEDSLFRRQKVTLNESEKSTTVMWSYSPWTVRVGGIISVVGFLILLLVVASPHYRRRFNSKPENS